VRVGQAGPSGSCHPPGGPPPAPITGQPGKPETKEHDMALFMDFHEDLTLAAEAIAQIADDTRNEKADQFGVRQVELYHNARGQVYCLLEGPDEEAIRRHHAALGVPCGHVHQVTPLPDGDGPKGIRPHG
jgi:Protein of unknown function (DUF4242)